MPRFMTIAWFAELHLAHFAKSRLDAEGIESFIPNENLISVHPFLKPLTNGVQLQVKLSDKKRAMAALGLKEEQ